MRSPRFFLGALLVLILILSAFFYRGEIGKTLRIIRPSPYGRGQELALEVEGLKAELQALREKNQTTGNYLTSRVYSSYPFSDRRLLVIDAGVREGIRAEAPVLVKEGVLLGKVKSVKRTQSIVQTIFDQEWRSSVIVGIETRALLHGGSPPILTLISRHAVLAPGDKVLNTSPEFPLGLFLGTVSELESGLEDVWLRARLTTLYQPEDLDEVLVVRDFP